MDILQLIRKAVEARSKAVAPYSKFQVGAVAVTSDNRIFTGCNVEVSSYGLTMCAERVAIFKALSEGEKKFKAIVIVADTETVCYPCGACRQVIWDFAPDAKIICANLHEQYEMYQPGELIPNAFGPESLQP